MLAAEDALRLNVLLDNQPLAIRINESTMTVHGLTVRGEAEIRRHPDCRAEQYVKRVREMLSGHVLGSPGGYLVYLQRWTRMGQMRDQSLEQLLLLGEPEAVVAAVCAPGLTDELARRAWWVMEEVHRGYVDRPETCMSQAQTYLALGNALNGAKSHGFDACPMGGFDPAEYSRILKIPPHLVPVMLVS